jgi:hypothetical protein
MPEKTVKRRLQDCDAALASDDGRILSTVAKLVEALKRSIREGTQNAELKNEALRPGRELLRGTKCEVTEEDTRVRAPEAIAPKSSEKPRELVLPICKPTNTRERTTARAQSRPTKSS